MKASPFLYGSVVDESLKAVREGLEALLEPDQRVRARGQVGPEVWAEQRALDLQNVAALSQIIETHGWPTEEVFGEKAALAAFVVVQHAPLTVQERYLPLLQTAAERGEVSKSRLAFLLDRIQLYRNEPQVYGTQPRPNQETGELELYPLLDATTVDTRRADMGLEPLETYLTGFGLKEG